MPGISRCYTLSDPGTKAVGLKPRFEMLTDQRDAKAADPAERTPTFYRNALTMGVWHSCAPG